MKKKINKTILILCFVLVFWGISGCGKTPENAAADQPENVSTEQNAKETDEVKSDPITDEDKLADMDEDSTNADNADSDKDNTDTNLAEPATEPANEADAGDTSGAESSDSPYGVYLDKINELKSEGMADQFALVNIDEDDVPELIASDSKGSFDHENAFIFTIHNDEVVQLAAVITGVDGGSLDYAKGANLIHISGAAAGMREVFSKITDGTLEEVFTAESTSMDEDAEYSVNGSRVKEDEYYKEISGFVGAYNPLTRIAYDGLYEVNYKYDNGYGGFEQGGSEKYSSPEEIAEELK